jgi:hypothetical protein
MQYKLNKKLQQEKYQHWNDNNAKILVALSITLATIVLLNIFFH